MRSLLALAALLIATPLMVAEPDDSTVEQEVSKASYEYFRLKDGGDYGAAYALFAPSVKTYLTRDLYTSQSSQFNVEAGKAEERRVVKLTVYHDPPDAPAPGLYVAADFVARFPNIYLHCGYLMWHREKDGKFRLVREEQSFIDKGTAKQMAPERLTPLPKQFGCAGS